MLNRLIFSVVPSPVARVKSSQYVRESIAMNHGAEMNNIVLHLGFGRMLTLKAIAHLFILGCSWGLGFFLVEGVLDTIRSVVAYSFSIINVLQGIYIYLVYCLLNHKVNQSALHTFHCLLVSHVLPLLSVSWASPLLG